MKAMEARQMNKIARIEIILEEKEKKQIDTLTPSLPQGNLTKHEEELQELALELK